MVATGICVGIGCGWSVATRCQWSIGTPTSHHSIRSAPCGRSLAWLSRIGLFFQSWFLLCLDHSLLAPAKQLLEGEFRWAASHRVDHLVPVWVINCYAVNQQITCVICDISLSNYGKVDVCVKFDCVSLDLDWLVRVHLSKADSKLDLCWQFFRPVSIQQLRDCLNPMWDALLR